MKEIWRKGTNVLEFIPRVKKEEKCWRVEVRFRRKTVSRERRRKKEKEKFLPHKRVF